ncbi:heme-binding protein [Kitasatospora sp. NPDC059795]|uniref:heme-binding protein n=1 Tax=Kitasatospora sp. NPDC059795 TaxID=3346949 RepID=UPI0036498D4D
MSTTLTPLTTADAETLVAAARTAAEAAGVAVGVTVLDAGGHPLAFRRDDRAVLVGAVGVGVPEQDHSFAAAALTALG